VKARIVEGTYTPGYRLVLAKIAEDLGFSVVPVREAIRRLEAEGLVKFERNVGATVSGIDPTEYLYTMQTLSIVEGAATALSAPLIGGSHCPGPCCERRDARVPGALRPRPFHHAEPGLPQRPV
jgi:DNA-binding GntR family transcriptional regulator